MVLFLQQLRSDLSSLEVGRGVLPYPLPISLTPIPMHTSSSHIHNLSPTSNTLPIHLCASHIHLTLPYPSLTLPCFSLYIPHTFNPSLSCPPPPSILISLPRTSSQPILPLSITISLSSLLLQPIHFHHFPLQTILLPSRSALPSSHNCPFPPITTPSLP